MGTKAVSGANGKQGRVFIGTLELCVEEWALREMAGVEDTTNSCSNGQDEWQYTTKHCEGTLRLTLDLSLHPLDSPPALRTGTKVVNVTLYEHSVGTGSATGSRWFFTQIGIDGVNVTNPAKGKVQYEINWRSDGPYQDPSDNAGSSV